MSRKLGSTDWFKEFDSFGSAQCPVPCFGELFWTLEPRHSAWPWLNLPRAPSSPMSLHLTKLSTARLGCQLLLPRTLVIGRLCGLINSLQWPVWMSLRLFLYCWYICTTETFFRAPAADPHTYNASLYNLFPRFSVGMDISFTIPLRIFFANSSQIPRDTISR